MANHSFQPNCEVVPVDDGVAMVAKTQVRLSPGGGFATLQDVECTSCVGLACLPCGERGRVGSEQCGHIRP